MSDASEQRERVAPTKELGATTSGATRDFGGLDVDDPDYISVRLPPALEELFEPVRELASGGQAALVLCRRKASPDAVVAVKLYHHRVSPTKRDPRETFHDLPAEYAVQYVDPHFGAFNQRWWEVLEYLPLGNLKQLAQSQGGRLSDEQLQSLIAGTTETLEFLHSRTPKVIHRDIKPQNLLVRQLDPLSVVFIDFGLAVLVEQSRERHSGSRTDAYAAPEAPHGDTDPSLDWWSLGMTIAELAAGRHPYEEPDGRLMNDRAIASAIATRPVPLEGIADERLVLLLRGLLTRDPELRWSASQVRHWLAGESPEVVVETGTMPAAATSTPALRFLKQDHQTPQSLAKAIVDEWDRAGELLAGRDLKLLVDWVEEFFPANSIEDPARSFDRGRKDDETLNTLLARIVLRLDPRCEPVFAGERVDLPALGAMAEKLTPRLEQIVEWLFHSRLLHEYRRLPGQNLLGEVDEVWHELNDQAVEWFHRVPEARPRDHQGAAVGHAQAVTPDLRALLLRVAVARVAGIAR